MRYRPLFSTLCDHKLVTNRKVAGAECIRTQIVTLTAANSYLVTGIAILLMGRALTGRRAILTPFGSKKCLRPTHLMLKLGSTSKQLGSFSYPLVFITSIRSILMTIYPETIISKTNWGLNWAGLDQNFLSLS